MPDFGKFLQWGGHAGSWLDLSKSDIADYVINYQPITITIIRGTNTTLAPQTVFLAHPPINGRFIEGEAGVSGEVDMYLIGKSNLDIKEGDRFTYQGTSYRVKAVITSIEGRIKAELQGVR